MQRFSTVRLIVLRPLADLSKVSATPTIKLGAVHKVRHAIFGQFLPLPPVTLRHTSRDPPKVRHTSRTPPIFRRPSRKHPDKSPLCKFCLNCSRGVLSGGFVRGSFVWKVLSGVVFVRSRSVRIHVHLLQRKVKHHFKFPVSYMWIFFTSVTSHAL